MVANYTRGKDGAKIKGIYSGARLIKLKVPIAK